MVLDTLKTVLDLDELFFSASFPLCITVLPFAVQPCLTLCACLHGGCCALSPLAISDPFFHATRSPNQSLVLKRRMLTQYFLQPRCFPKCTVMHTEINNWSYLGALVREKTSCYKPLEVTISLLPIVFSSLS